MVLSLFRSLGLESDIVSSKECAQICPILNTEDVVGAIYVSNDISAGDPGDICRALSLEARSEGNITYQEYVSIIYLTRVYTGVKLFEDVSVQGIEVKDGKVDAVKTNKGNIECEFFINCAGMVSMEWAVHSAIHL